MAADVNNETQDSPDLINLIGQLSQLMQAEKSRTRSNGRSGSKNEFESSAGRSRGERSHSPLRSSLKSNGAGRDQAAMVNDRTDQLKRQILDLQAENDKMRRNIDDVMIRHHHELENKEGTIRDLSSNLN